MRILIVGGVAAGASAAARARRLCESADITVIERGPDVSFANCGLPYHIGDEIPDRSRLALQTPESLAALLNVRVRVHTEAVGIDRARKILRVRAADKADEEEIAYDKLILAPGASPARPPLPGIDSPRVHTLRNLQDMDKIKSAAASASRVVVVGAGFIGLELAEQFVRMGKRVALIEAAPHVLPQLDADMAFPVEDALRNHGVDLTLGDPLAGFFEESGQITARLVSGKSVSGDLVVLCIGVRPESALAAAAGLELGARGAIRVNPWMQTSDPDIYAAGDAVESRDRITGQPMNLPLGGPANRQGRLIADHIFTPEQARPYPGHLGTAIVRVFDVAVGLTGWTHKRLTDAGIPHESTVVSDYHHANYFPGARLITLKILWSPETGKVLGAQAFGAEGVDKRLDVLATAIAAGFTVDDLTELELSYAPPFGSARDVVNTAGFAAQNNRRALVRTIGALPGEGHILDVRPALNAQNAPIPGAINIPLAQLRGRLHELSSIQPWITVCAMGKSSYFAARILAQRGYQAFSLSGGWNFHNHDKPAAQSCCSCALPSGQSAPMPKGTSSACEGKPAASSQSSQPETVHLDCAGLSCPGPLLRVKESVGRLLPSQVLEVRASDPGFARDVEAFCRSCGYTLANVETRGGVTTARIACGQNAAPAHGTSAATTSPRRKGATVVVFSGELDKVMAALVIANGAAALGGDVTLFFTFWGINALRKETSVPVKDKSPLDRMFGWMLPRGVGKLPLSKMHFGGAGSRMMKYQMASKGLPNLPGLLGAAKLAGVRLVACTMAMEAMGIRREELIDGVELGGVADYLESAELAGTNLFV